MSASVPQQPPRLLPPHYFILALVLMGGCLLLPEARVLPKPWLWLGVLPVVIGLGIAAKGSRQFAIAGTNIVPFTTATTLVVDGVFAYSRNPMYLGFVLALVGAATLVNHVAAWLPLAAFVIIVRWGFIRGEEAQMQATFGADYEDYCRRVARWM